MITYLLLLLVVPLGKAFYYATMVGWGSWHLRDEEQRCHKLQIHYSPVSPTKFSFLST